jgi:hypothetical protein
MSHERGFCEILFELLQAIIDSVDFSLRHSGWHWVKIRKKSWHWPARRKG